MVKKSIFTLLIFVFNVFFLTTSFATPPSIPDPKLLRDYHDSGQYHQDLHAIATKANDYLNQQVMQNKQSKNPKKLALVLDIDETTLSNYNNMSRRNFIGDKAQFEKEVNAADAPAIKPMLKLYQKALENKIDVFFITARGEAQTSATKKNLIRMGYTKWSGLYLKPKSYKQHSSKLFKTSVRQYLSKRGYTILATIGDQYCDLDGGYAMKSFKLPNPYYKLP